MLEFNSEWTLVIIITILAVISPGPDFAITTRNTLLHGRKAGLVTAFGVATGISVHITYTSLGLGYLISESVWLLDMMRYLGAAYLIYLGFSSFRLSKSGNGESHTQELIEQSSITVFINGFLSNALNPKTALFFIALFTQVIAVDTPLHTLIGLGLFIAMAHYFWFSAVAILLTSKQFKVWFNSMKVWIDRLIGLSLIGLGAQLAMGNK